jgi:tryptophan-rich sensory protein
LKTLYSAAALPIRAASAAAFSNSAQWYQSLTKPPLTPPNWIFGPVWTLLYAMIAVSILTFHFSGRQPTHSISDEENNADSNLSAECPSGKSGTKSVTALTLFHLMLNFSWSWLFFGIHSPSLALADILLLDLTLFKMIKVYRKRSRASALLLVPYLIWVLFATYLNLGFVILNTNK